MKKIISKLNILSMKRRIQKRVLKWRDWKNEKDRLVREVVKYKHRGRRDVGGLQEDGKTENRTAFKPILEVKKKTKKHVNILEKINRFCISNQNFETRKYYLNNKVNWASLKFIILISFWRIRNYALHNSLL